MYRPGDCGEWIELFNRSAAPIDLSGWRIGDNAGARGTIAAGTSVSAGAFVVIAQDPASFLSRYPGCHANVIGLEGGWPRLNDGSSLGIADVVFVHARDGLLAESVSYPGICGSERGRSIERISPDICSADPAGIWLRCADVEGATPGRENYCNTAVIPGSGVELSVDPFRPAHDGPVRITAAVLPGEDSFNAFIYDMEGREIRRLPSGPVAASAVSFVWDGRDDCGRSVCTGLYICVVEFMGGGGGVCRRERRRLAVWAGG
jgi:hypothetical protein